ncbi:MAG TPA: hypothetical protein VLA19_01850 [Herpetosiphonaceae bacterium]|nr:hypothetical protein [Herpetosiphonaceae bacterium]
MQRFKLASIGVLLVLLLAACGGPANTGARTTIPTEGTSPAAPAAVTETRDTATPVPDRTSGLPAVTTTTPDTASATASPSATATAPIIGAEPPASETPIPGATAPVMGVEPTASETPLLDPTAPVMGLEPTASEVPASGSLIAYVHERNIWLLNPSTGETRRATSNGASDMPAWTADRHAVLFVVESDEDTGIYMLTVGGAGPELLVDGPAPELFPAAAPDGRVFYVRHIVDDAGSRWQIVRHDSGGEGQVVYTLETGLCSATDLRVSNTRWMLALGCGRGTAVMVGDLAGGEGVDLGQQLGDSGGCLYGGAWSRVAPEHLFVLQSEGCDPASASTIASVDVASGTPSTEPALIDRGIGSIDTSPDGREIVFGRSGPGGASEGLWVVGIGGQSEPRLLTPEGARPAWRP